MAAGAGKSLLLLVLLGFTSPALAGFRQVAAVTDQEKKDHLKVEHLFIYYENQVHFGGMGMYCKLRHSWSDEWALH